jgi:hypothetical protein
VHFLSAAANENGWASAPMRNRASRNELPHSKLRGIHPKRFKQNRLKPPEKIIPVEIGPKHFPPFYSPANDMVQRTSGINASVAWHVVSISFDSQTRNSYPYTCVEKFILTR